MCAKTTTIQKYINGHWKSEQEGNFTRPHWQIQTQTQLKNTDANTNTKLGVKLVGCPQSSELKEELGKYLTTIHPGFEISTKF